MPTSHDDAEPQLRPRLRRGRQATAQTPGGTLLRRMHRHVTGRRLDGGRRGWRGVYVPSPRTAAQRVVVKAQIVTPGMSGHRSWKAELRHHLQYVQREGVARDGAAGQMYTREDDGIDPSGFLGRSTTDPHQFRVIVSPERGQDLDLTTFTRDLMTQVETDLGTGLDWAAVNHYDTDHPHTHVVLRGRDTDEQPLYMTPSYIADGIRCRAQELATRALGYRLEMAPAQEVSRQPRHDRGMDMDMDF